MSEKDVIDNENKSSLYLVCPLDYLEYSIKTSFNGDAYFCTALGVYFEFDLDTQFNLWNIIHENNIGQVVLVTSLNNPLYKKAFENEVECSDHLAKSLYKTCMKIGSNRLMNLFHQNLYLLVYWHLKKQMTRLMRTEYLGKKIKSNGMLLKAFIRQPKQNRFCDLEEMAWKGHLFNNISYN